MQDTNPIQPMLQPFFKLAQSNIALLTQFSFSPEVVSQAFGNAQGLFQRTQDSTGQIAQSTAFAELAQGLMKNYTEFLMELGQGGMAMLSQGQAAFLRHAQEASSNVVDATQARRTRQAA
jgi:hypothetical protein